MVIFTSNLSRLVRELLNFLLCQDSEYNDTIETFFESFLGCFEGFRVDQAAIDLGPTRARRDALLCGL